MKKRPFWQWKCHLISNEYYILHASLFLLTYLVKFSSRYELKTYSTQNWNYKINREGEGRWHFPRFNCKASNEDEERFLLGLDVSMIYLMRVTSTCLYLTRIIYQRWFLTSKIHTFLSFFNNLFILSYSTMNGLLSLPTDLPAL